VFLIDGTETLAADVDLGVPAAVGTWYRVAFDLNALTGGYRARVTDVATGTLLVDRVDAFAGWLSGSGPFDAVGFFDGEGGVGVTRSNLAVVDNINVRATPEPASLFLLGAGFAAMLAHARRRERALR
jgi:hypothetical protein